jgi:hypothetical protein
MSWAVIFVVPKNCMAVAIFGWQNEVKFFIQVVK